MHSSLLELTGLPDSSLKPIQRVLNTTARVVSRSLKFAHTTPLLKDLHWLPVKFRVQFKIMLLLFKVMQGDIVYLAEFVHYYQPRPGLRSECKSLLRLPRTRISYGDRSFSAMAPLLYNDLPQIVRSAPTVNAFKNLLKTHYFTSF